MSNPPEENRTKLILEALRATAQKNNSSDVSIKQDLGLKNEKQNNRINQIFRMVHRELLTRPPCRRLQTWPNPKFEGPFEISRAALRGKVSSRLNYLAKPKKDFYCEANDFLTSSVTSFNNKDKRKRDITRLLELSQPRPLLDIVDDNIKSARFKNQQQWLAYLKKLRLFAAARRTPPSPLEPKRVKTPLETILPHLEHLSKPAYRPSNNNEWTFEELHKIKNSVLKYVASDRIKKLAVPKPLTEEMIQNLTYNPRTKLLNAKKYKATERIVELAKPIIKTTPKDTDTKANAYTVNPKALKARCTKRIKQLAKPIKRDF